MSTNFDDVGDFHEKFGLDNVTHGDAGPRPMDKELMGFRLNFLLEELKELMEAVGATFVFEDDDVTISEPGDIVDHAQAFDALLDLNYVSHGTAHLLGYPWQIGWNAVQNANMAKVRAAHAGESKRGSSFDVIKPPGWYPPNIQRVLESHGFRVQKLDCPVCGDAYDDENTACEPGICRKGA